MPPRKLSVVGPTTRAGRAEDRLSATPIPVYQLKVQLRWIKPPIWRRLLVPWDLTLAQLHSVLQVAIGWHNCHLYEFTVGRTSYSTTAEDLFGGFGDDSGEDAAATTLDQVMGQRGKKLGYLYDFGDS